MAAAQLAFGQAQPGGGKDEHEAPELLRNLSLSELMDVEVTSVARHPERLSRSPSAIQVISGDEIHRAGASTLPEALRLADNLDVARRNSHDWAISARGFNTELANKLLVLVDGRSVYTPLFSGVFWDAQDTLLEDVDRIEVISGPGGTLWGANAVNGVINVISKSSRETQGLYLEAGGGSTLDALAGARYGGRVGETTTYRVYGKYLDRGAEALADGASAGDAWRMGRGGFRVDGSGAAGAGWTVEGDVYGGTADEPAGGATAGGATALSGGNVLARWSRDVGPRSSWSLQIYYDWTHLEDPTPAFLLGGVPLAPAGTLRDDLATCDLDFQRRTPIGRRNEVVFGFGYRNLADAVSNAPAVSFLPTRLRQSLESGFVQDELRVRDGLVLTVGMKVEHNDYTGVEVEPNVRLAWDVSGRRTVWAAASRAVRTPSRIDRDLFEPSPQYLVVLRGSDAFASESLLAYELGERREIGDRFATSAALFYNDYENLRSTSVTPGTVIPFYFANDLLAETYGAELTGTYRIDDEWRLIGGYDLLREHLHVARGALDINQGQNETADPEQQVSLRSETDLTHGVSLDGALRWIDALHPNNGPVTGRVPSYFELDLRAGWRGPGPLEVSLVGHNLLHAQHPEYGFPSPTRVELTRSFYLRLEWRLGK